MDNYSPYDSSQPPAGWPYGGHRGMAPTVVWWYKLYCILMTLACIGSFILGLVLAMIDPADLAELGVKLDPTDVTILAVVLVIVGMPLSVLFGIAPFLPDHNWSWVYGFVTIGIGMVSCCCLPACLPLLIFWVHPQTRVYFHEWNPIS